VWQLWHQPGALQVSSLATTIKPVSSFLRAAPILMVFGLFRARLWLLLAVKPRFHESKEIKAMTTFYAQPYSIEHTGFYFDSLKAFEEGMEKLEYRGCEEVEILFIDGECGLSKLASAAGIDQSTESLWFEELDDLDSMEIDQICYLLDCGYDLEDALTRYEYVNIFHGTAADYAQELIEETTVILENLRYYIDYKAIARDMGYNGEIVEIDREVIVTNAHEF
jgi:antirestriction protein